MDWNPIILAVIGVVLSWETVNNIKYRRENKRLKENEVKTSDVDTQKAQIELGDLFLEKAAGMFQQMQELQEKTLLATQKNGIDNESIIKKMDELAEEQKRIAEVQEKQGEELKRQGEELKRQGEELKRQGEELKRQGEELKRLSEGQEHMVSFLNGEYQSFLKENGFKTKKRSRYDNAK